MSQHTTRTISPRGFHRGRRGFGGGFGSGMFEPNLTPGPGGIPVDNSVQTSELAVTGTFAARAPTLLSEASKYQTQGMVTSPSVQYVKGGVITSDGRQTSPPEGWSPDPRTWGSPTDAITGAKRNVASADERAVDNQLDPSVTPPPGMANESVDGTWVVGPDGEPAFIDNAPRMNGGGMKWWHWGLIGAAVLGGGFVLMRVLTK